MSRFFIAILIAFVLTTRVSFSAQYPIIDETSQWIGGPGLSGGSLSTLSKSIDNGGGFIYPKGVFYNIALQGVKIDGTVYPLNNTNQIESELQFSGSTYIQWIGTYMFNWSTPLNRYLDTTMINYKFYNDGRFYIDAGWFSNTTLNPPKPLEAYFLVDYDLDGSSDDIMEFTWADQNNNPPLSVASMTYSQPSGNNWVNYWGAVPNETQVTYPASFHTETFKTVEVKPVARIVNAATSETQMGIVFWDKNPNFDNAPFVSTDKVLDLTLKSYSSSLTLPPSATPSVTTQTCGFTSPYSRYAHSGSDQLLQISLKDPSMEWNEGARIWGKLFIKPNSRPLRMSIHYHPNVGSWASSIATTLIRNVSGENRTIRTAFERLVADPVNLTTSSTTMSMMPGYSDNQSVDAAALHNMLQNCTDCRDYLSQKQNVLDWQVDAYLVNWTYWTGTSTAGTMFDSDGYPTSRYDGIAREAAAIFWPAHLNSFSTDAIRRSEAALSIAHEVGHTFNFLHEWSSCHGTMGGTCTSGPLNPPDIMSYYAASDAALPNNVRFNEENPVSGGWDRNLKRFYQQAPEAWVKPGVNGFKFIPLQTGIPNYITY